uniref:Non-specific serine/threonine protein kinase n=2 Tax=Meloidogyne incognita group TaxID=654580 RepID=A0A914M180_MELIC
MRLIRGGSLHGHSSSSSYYSSNSAENSSISFNSAEINNYFYEGRGGLMYLNNDSVASAIFLACERGALPELRQFVSSCFIELANLKNELEETPLHVASGNGFEELVHFLLKCGCNPNIGDGQGDTPLIWAARNGHTNVFKYLLKSIEMVNATNKNQETALHIATRYTQGKAVLALLEAGADPHLMDKHLETSLHIAAWDGQNGLLDLLCRFSHFLDIQNSDGDSALHIAAIRGHLECLESLLENGAQVDLQNQSGQTALHMALSRGHVDIAILLLGRGCNSTIQDQNGDTPLHLAAEKGLFTIAQTICQLNIPIDIQNSQGLSPLHVAARFGSIEIVRCLCLAGANVHLKTNDGMTAEIVALAQEHKHIAVLLGKVKQEKEKQKFVEQLTTLDIPLNRIKLKVFGSQGAGKTRLIQALQRPSSASSLNSLVESVSRRFSGSLFLSSSTTQTGPPSVHSNKGNQNNDCAFSSSTSDEGIHSATSSTSSTSSSAINSQQQQQLPPPNRHKTWPYSNNTISGNNNKEFKNGQQGIDIQNMSFTECGEFSVWNFSGHEPSHICYDHFVGNTDCVHLVVTRCSDDPQDEYKELLYWLNFLKGRVTPTEPIGHCGLMARRAVVAIVGTFCGTDSSSSSSPSSPSQPPITLNEAEAMMKTLKMRFETHFEIHPQLLLVDLSAQTDCKGLKELRNFLVKSRESILQRLQRPLRLLDPALFFLEQLREKYSQFPCVTWNYFTYLIPSEVNPLASDGHCRQLIQQLQLIGEVVYLRDECKELDYIVISPEWLGTHLLGTLFSNQFAQTNRTNGRLMFEDFAAAFPEVADTGDLLQIMETLQICSLVEPDFEFPAFITCNPPIDIWQPNRPQFLYAGLRIKPARGMEQTMQAIFPRIQVSMRKSMQDFQDSLDAELLQWKGCSKMLSGKMEALVRLIGDSVEVQIRGPSSMSNSAIYFLEDLTNLVEQTAAEVAPGISIERHFLSPKHLKEHRTNPASFTPEVIMEMQLNESLIIENSDGEQEEFTDVVCFGSTEVAGLLSLGIDISVAQLQPCTRSELAALLDPSDPMGRDWSILAVRLNLAEALPSVDSTGQSLSRTDQLLAEWAITTAGNASIGRLATILSEMGRDDVKQLLFRRVPLYLFNSTPQIITENNIVNNNEII